MTSKSLARQGEVVGRSRFAGVFLVLIGLYSTDPPCWELEWPGSPGLLTRESLIEEGPSSSSGLKTKGFCSNPECAELSRGVMYKEDYPFFL